jgi:hypothetical protein
MISGDLTFLYLTGSKGYVGLLHRFLNRLFFRASAALQAKQAAEQQKETEFQESHEAPPSFAFFHITIVSERINK